MRELDRYMIEEIGLPGVVLMENAGKAVADEITRRFAKPKTAVVLAGTGNNGGDGWVTARHLVYRGWRVHLWLVGTEEKLTYDARVFYSICKRLAPINYFNPEEREHLARHLAEADVIVDAMLGTGAKGELRPPVAEVVRLIDAVRDRFVVAVDLPTGVDADTGAVFSEAVQADLTVTFEYPKWGHYLRPGAERCGQVKVAKIGIAPVERGTRLEPSARLNLPLWWEAYAKPRMEWAHKGTYGHLLVVGGAKGMLGAVTMAGEAAYRTGVGYVTLTVPESERLPLAVKTTQELIWSWPGEGVFAADSFTAFLERKCRFSAVAIGPGLGRFAGEERWLGELMAHVEVPLVLDADACNILADYPHLLNKRPPSVPTVLTPHPGEMARLVGLSVAQVEAERPKIANYFAMKTGTIVVLKGRYSVIAFPDGRQMLNLTGSPALAKAGSGDLLTGMIGALLAMRIPAVHAVPMAVYMHGKAGEKAGTHPHSVMFSDLLKAIAQVYRELLVK
jgi:NAD(P)H-hydrate epimerase